MPDITIAGATFRNVPQIDVPKDGGGSASFIYEEGTKQINTNGTHDVSGYLNAQVSVPSQSPVINPLTVTENGTYTAPSGVDGYSPVTVNVSGGGGGDYEYETGTWTPAEDVAHGEVSFDKTHDTLPIAIIMHATNAAGMGTDYTNYSFIYCDLYEWYGASIPTSNSAVGTIYGYIMSNYIRTGSTVNSTRYINANNYIDQTSSATNKGFYVSYSKFMPYCSVSTGATSYMWRSNLTYKWLAIWKKS